MTGLEVEFKDNYQCPFVKTPVQIAWNTKMNTRQKKTVLYKAQMKTIYLQDKCCQKTVGSVLKGNVVSINGLDGYALPKLWNDLTMQGPKDLIMQTIANALLEYTELHSTGESNYENFDEKPSESITS